MTFIIETLKASPDDSITAASLLWEYHLSAPNSVGKNIPKHKYTSFNRSINTLAENGEIVIEERKLSSLEECAAHYPFKALDYRKYELRKTILPTFVDLKNEAELFPKYHSGKNEDYFMNHLSAERLEELRKQWSGIDYDLRQLLASQHDPQSHLLELVYQGRTRFMKSISSTNSLENCITNFKKNYPDKVNLITTLETFYEAFFPTQKQENLEFKSYLHELVDLTSSGSYSLRTSAIEKLEERHEKFFTSFFNIKYPTPPDKKNTSDWMMFQLGEGLNRNPLYATQELRKLFDQSVLKTFKFLTLPGRLKK